MEEGPVTAWTEIQYLRELLQEMVSQNCSSHRRPGILESGFISTHAEAIRYLCQVGMLEKLADAKGTRWVEAKSVWPG